MSCPVDAVRSAGYDDRAGGCELAGEVTGEHLSITACRPRAHDRDSARSREQRRVSANPEHCRRMHPEVVERSRPEVVPRQKQPSADLGCRTDRIENAARIRADHPPGSSLGESPFTDLRTRHGPSADRQPQ